MSTRSYFGIRARDERISLHYCHHDGYLEGVGAYLLENVHTLDEARELMKAGDRSGIDDAEGYKDGTSHEFENMDALHNLLFRKWGTDVEYIYIFDEESAEWYYTARHYKNGKFIWHDFIPLAAVLNNHGLVFPRLGSDTLANFWGDCEFETRKRAWEILDGLKIMGEFVNGTQEFIYDNRDRARRIERLFCVEEMQGNMRALERELMHLLPAVKHFAYYDHAGIEL
ncbi:MAG: hypothetical protein Q4C88_05905 [Akkermansia sp.]|nr:hypothetical protein [Akkermansia sp.]